MRGLALFWLTLALIGCTQAKGKQLVMADNMRKVDG